MANGKSKFGWLVHPSGKVEGHFVVAEQPVILRAGGVEGVYTRGGALYWRQQRDRYAVERLVGATTKKVIRTGLSSANRLQFEYQ